MSAILPHSVGAFARRVPEGLRPGAVAMVVVALALVVPAMLWRTTLDMVQIWTRSETFAHGYLVLPIFAYLVWRQRASIATIPAQPFKPAFVGVAIAGAGWWIGGRLSVPVLQQFSMVAMAVLGMWAVLGTRLCKMLGFPLAFLFFAVPMGEFLVPVMIDRTADFTVLALRASGVPVYRENNYLMLPTGMWSVVEACSGLRYLIASLMVGVLFAYLTYRSAVRRAAFIGASVVVPIIANWVRAYLIVMLGHLSNNRIAVGIDHIIYGWIFFGVVMLLLFSIGSRWREDPAEAATPMQTPASSFQITGAVLVATAAVALLAFGWGLAGASTTSEPRPVQLPAIAVSGGWVPIREPVTTFRPEISGQSGELTQTYEKNGARVSLQILFFSDQQPGHQAISTRNHLVWNSKVWWQVASATANGAVGRVRTGVVTDRQERIAVWQWFWIDGRTTSNPYVGQFYRLLGMVTGKSDTAAWIMVYAPALEGGQQAGKVIGDFVAAAAPSIDASLRRAGSSAR
jgi:exosortase A